MQNYSQIFAATLAEFESPIVPADQADAGKGQLLVRAGYRIFQATNPNIGYIKKNPGQTQFHGVGVDALLDRSDGTGADFITDVEIPGDPGHRMIKLAYSVYPPPPPGSDPAKGWVQPSTIYVDYPGPMKLKGGPPIPIPPIPNPPVPVEPMPPMPTTWSEAEYGTLQWTTDMSPRLDAVYCNLFTRPGGPLRHGDYGGWGNWVYHIVFGKRDVQWVVAAMKTSEEYKLIHPEG